MLREFYLWPTTEAENVRYWFSQTPLKLRDEHDAGSVNQMHPHWTLKEDPAVLRSGTVFGSDTGCHKLELPGHNDRALSRSILG